MNNSGHVTIAFILILHDYFDMPATDNTAKQPKGSFIGD
jgi:hypothetical protein